MRAIVMAAGLGTRLKPLTNDNPKPLVPVAGRPMVEFVLSHLASHGFKEALINIHYLPEKMRAFVARWNRDGRLPRLEIQDESDKILGSGGALVKAASWLFEHCSSALVCNADVLAAPDLTALQSFHERLKGEGVGATLIYTAHPEAGRKYNGLRVHGERVESFSQPGIASPELFHFPGFYVVEKSAVARLPGAGEISVLEKMWKPLAADGKLGAFLYEGYYFDLGTAEDLQIAEHAFQSGIIAG